MGLPFARRPIPSSNPSPVANQNEQDPAAYAEEMLKRSGGDARAAFYLACQDKGVDPNVIIPQVQSLKNPQALLQNALMNSPRGKSLLSLFSLVK